MAVNYAEKYSDKVDERFTLASMTQPAFNQDYDWDGVSTVHVYSVNTAPLNDYVMSGNQRYGTPDELGNATQAMTLQEDKSFTFTIDRRNYVDTMMVMESGRALRRQTDEILIPHVDRFRIARLAALAGTITPPTPIDNAYEVFLDGVTTLIDNKAPLAGTFCFAGTNFYKKIRLDDAFIKSGDMSQQMLVTGQVGMVENIPVIYIPQSYFPAGVEFLITNRVAALSPTKLAEYKIHDNPPGINGWLVEGRMYFDTFVLNNKNKAIYVHRSA